jgi:glucose/arabinose dehydrogenase
MIHASRPLAAAVATAAAIGVAAHVAIEGQTPVTVTIVATGLNDPRGMTFGPDEGLYVAEAGPGGGTLSTIGQCDQVEPPVGPFLAGHLARVVRIDSSGHQTVVADGLPSSEATPLVGGDRQGAASVAFVGNRLLALVAGAGCSHGHASADNGVLEVDGGMTSELANLSSWIRANPGAKGEKHPRDADYEPDGVWYSLLFSGGRLYAVEPNHGLLVTVHHERGTVELVSDLLAAFGDNTYTALAADRGDLYVGTLGRIAWLTGVFPPVPDLGESFKGDIYRLSRNGESSHVATGLRAVLGLAFDARHRLYALQSPIFVPGTGSLVRQTPDGQWETVVSGLVFPSGLTRGPDGAIYISECGYHCAPGQGRILRVAVP